MTINYSDASIMNNSLSKGLDLISGNTLLLKGKKVPLLCGEVHFFRMDPEVWEPCLKQVKNLGLPIVSTYLSWYRFSTGPGQYDLEGVTNPRLNVRKFLDLCSKYDLYVTIKPGPWICAEETNGGYPEWLVQIRDAQVLDSQAQPVKGYNYPFQSPIPSYFHPEYQKHVGQWLKSVDDVIKDYCYPNGPIILMQLDNEPCFTFHDRMFESDYNPVISKPGGLYSQWLEEKYQSVEELNTVYGTQQQDFTTITPPRELELGRMKEIARFMDWVEFKENLFARHVSSIGQHHLNNGIDEVLFTINCNLHPQLATPNNWDYLEKASGICGYDYYPTLPMDFENFVDVVKAVNYSRSVNRIVWSPEIMTGIWSFANQEHRGNELKSSEFEYLYLTCLAYGLKGMNFYMLADRDNWVNSPINTRGQMSETADSVKKTIQIMQSIPNFYDFQVEQLVGVLYYRPYAREAFIVNENPKTIDGYSLGKAYQDFDNVYSNLIGENVNAGIFDPDINPECISRFKLVVAPCSRFMDRKTQQILLNYIEHGGNVVCFPEIPGYDWDESRVDVLKNALGRGKTHLSPSWKTTQIGDGCLIEMSQSDYSRDSLGELIRFLSIQSPVTSKDPRVKTTLLSKDSNQLYFVVNTADEEIDTELRFAEIREGTLENVLYHDWPLIIEKNMSNIRIPKRSVNVFWRKPC